MSTLNARKDAGIAPEDLDLITIGEKASSVRILYINPNTSLTMSSDAANYFSNKIAPDVRVDFYTPAASKLQPSSCAPPSIDGIHDGVTSTFQVLKDFQLLARESENQNTYLSKTYDAIIVGCFSAHPLLPTLKECLPAVDKRPASEDSEAQLVRPPVLGIFEASVHYALQLGNKFGIATTGRHWEPLFHDHLRTLGVSPGRVAGVRGVGLNAISLHGDGAFQSILEAAWYLVNETGADVIVLGCGGMASLAWRLEKAIRQRTNGRHVPVVDGVQAAIETGAGMARMGMRI